MCPTASAEAKSTGSAHYTRSWLFVRPNEDVGKESKKAPSAKPDACALLAALLGLAAVSRAWM